MKTAIVHDWLYTYAGAERVLEQLLAVWPEADIFSLIDALPEHERSFLGGRPVKTSFAQKLPFVGRHHRAWLPLFPLAIEQFDLSEYDLVVSSSYAVAKGVLTTPLQRHLCYCHSPMRYAWDLQHQYLKESKMDKGVRSILARMVLHYIRVWDMASSPRVDQFVANSSFVQQRINRCYGRSSCVVHPPVDVNRFNPGSEKSDYYVTASRMVPYKRIDLVVEAFARMPDKKLVVIGDGPGFSRIRDLAGPNISLLGYQPHDVLVSHLQKAKAFVFAAEEDFGIAPIEAQACGTPVIAFGKGGIVDSVIPLGMNDATGVFFDRQTVDSICDAVKLFDDSCHRIHSNSCRINSLRFSPEIFRQKISNLAQQL